jgi:hypothetical protein
MEKTQEYYLNAYIEQLSPKEKKAYEIAKSHLQTSFDLEKSIGFKQYMSKISPTKSSG